MSKQKISYSTTDVVELFYKQWLKTAGDDKKFAKNHVIFLTETILEFVPLNSAIDKVHIQEIFNKYNYPYKLKIPTVSIDHANANEPIPSCEITEIEPRETDENYVVIDFQGVRTLWEFSDPERLEEFTNKVDELGYCDMVWHHPDNVKTFSRLKPDNAIKMLVKHYGLGEWDDHVRY